MAHRPPASPTWQYRVRCRAAGERYLPLAPPPESPWRTVTRFRFDWLLYWPGYCAEHRVATSGSLVRKSVAPALSEVWMGSGERSQGVSGGQRCQKETDRQTDRQTHTHRQTYRHTDRQIDMDWRLELGNVIGGTARWLDHIGGESRSWSSSRRSDTSFS